MPNPFSKNRYLSSGDYIQQKRNISKIIHFKTNTSKKTRLYSTRQPKTTQTDNTILFFLKEFPKNPELFKKYCNNCLIPLTLSNDKNLNCMCLEHNQNKKLKKTTIFYECICNWSVCNECYNNKIEITIDDYNKFLYNYKKLDAPIINNFKNYENYLDLAKGSFLVEPFNEPIYNIKNESDNKKTVNNINEAKFSVVDMSKITNNTSNQSKRTKNGLMKYTIPLHKKRTEHIFEFPTKIYKTEFINEPVEFFDVEEKQKPLQPFNEPSFVNELNYVSHLLIKGKRTWTPHTNRKNCKCYKCFAKKNIN